MNIGDERCAAVSGDAIAVFSVVSAEEGWRRHSICGYDVCGCHTTAHVVLQALYIVDDHAEPRWIKDGQSGQLVDVCVQCVVSVEVYTYK